MMKLTLDAADPLKHACRALVVGCHEGAVPDDQLLNDLDTALAGVIRTLFQQKEFTGRLNSTKLIHTLGRLPMERLLLVGLGKKAEFSPEKLRQGAGTAIQVLRSAGVTKYSSVIHLAGGGDGTQLRAAAEGTLLGGYRFDIYKTGEAECADVEEVTFLHDTAALQEFSRVLDEAVALSESVIFARDLVAQPGNVATPTYLAEKALELARHHDISCQVLGPVELEEAGMEGILAVARGSRQPPRFIVLEYHKGEKGLTPIVLVGKGITFDSGGISLKPREGMEMMKFDMAGAAAVLGTLMAAARLELPLRIVGLIPAAENLPDGGAYKPGDVIRTMSGKTVEIVNTDAEGRMLLCDALHFARKYRPAALIDVATLTGACIVALGNVATGIMGNDAGLKRALKSAGDVTGERVWEMPLWDEYGELLKSDIADLKNAGGATAGTVTAGWFLQQFVGRIRWAHLDIAGTAWEEKGRPYVPKGGTGVGVRLLVEYLRSKVTG